MARARHGARMARGAGFGVAGLLAPGCGGGSAPAPDVEVYVRATIDGTAWEGGSAGAVYHGADAVPSLDLWPAEALAGSLMVPWSPGDTGDYALGDDDAADALLVWIPEAGQEYCSTAGTLTLATWDALDDPVTIGVVGGTFEATLEGCLGAEGTVEVTGGSFASLVEDLSSAR